MVEECAREGCDNPARRNSKYCSTDCRWRNSNDKREHHERKPPKKVVEKAQLTRINQLLTDSGIAIEDIGDVKAVKITDWTGLAKGVDGEETRVVDLKSTSIVLHPTWATGPKWPVVQPAKPVVVQVPKRTQSGKGALVAQWKTALIIPDPQYGFRRDIYTAELDPFHDERALDIMLQIAELERPDLSIWLGDVLDYAMFSNKFLQEEAFALTVQPTLQAAYEDIAVVAELSRENRFIEGNHDLRLQTKIITDARAAFGLKRAGSPPEEWPVLSVPNLLRFNELGVEYVGGYPAGATYINDNLACIHGKKIGTTTRSAASMVVEDERVSVIFGHTHHHETRGRTRNTRGGAKSSVAHSPGCLCRIDGAVPSTKGAIDAFGRAVKSFEDWQQGVTVVRYKEGDGKFKIENVEIFEGWAMHASQEFISRVTPKWATPVG